MKIIEDFQKKHMKKTIPNINSGDIVRVHERIKEGKKERIQIFEGIVIATHRKKNLDATFKVRKISFGIGVEKTFPLHAPNVNKVEIIKSIKNKQSKLYYLRNLTDKQIKRKGELAKFAVWLDETAQAKEDELKKEKEEAAKAKEEAKKKEQEELDKKFTEIRGNEEPKKEENKDNKEVKNESKKEEAGK